MKSAPPSCASSANSTASRPTRRTPAAGEVDLRDEIEAEIEAATAEEAEVEEDEEPESDDEDGEKKESSGDGERPKRRRRRGRRGGRGRRKDLEATFDHGETDGYGLWLDPSVKDNPVYAEHWAGKREVTVRIDADQIVIRRAGEPAAAQDDADVRTTSRFRQFLRAGPSRSSLNFFGGVGLRPSEIGRRQKVQDAPTYWDRL